MIVASCIHSRNLSFSVRGIILNSHRVFAVAMHLFLWDVLSWIVTSWICSSNSSFSVRCIILNCHLVFAAAIHLFLWGVLSWIVASCICSSNSSFSVRRIILNYHLLYSQPHFLSVRHMTVILETFKTDQLSEACNLDILEEIYFQKSQNSYFP